MFVYSIITHEPLDLYSPQILIWELRKNHGNVLDLVLKFEVEWVEWIDFTGKNAGKAGFRS